MRDGGIGLPGNAEEMAHFFNVRAETYEEHMRCSIDGFDAFYRAVGDATACSATSPQILDLGVGTGLELDILFQQHPQAVVTGIDVSSGMLDRLRAKDRPWQTRLLLVQGSFLELDLGEALYDVVVSVMALHHWTGGVKRSIYRRIHRALRPGGIFVNGDYVDSTDESTRRLSAFIDMGLPAEHSRHIDLPLTVETERQLLQESGFDRIAVPYQQHHACVMVGKTQSEQPQAEGHDEHSSDRT